MLPLPRALLKMAVFAGFSLSVLAQTGPQLSIGPGRIYTVAGGATAEFRPTSIITAAVFDNNKATLYLADSQWNVYKQQNFFNTYVYALNLNTGQARIVIASSGSRNITDCTPGTPASCPGDGGPAISAKLGVSQGLALDSAGNLFIADVQNRVIRRVDANTGIITTIAGTGNYASSGDGGPATQASFIYPTGIAFDAANNLYIADWGGDRVRMISPAGQISAVAGTGASGYSGDGGPATSAQFSGPVAVAIGPSGNLLIADSGNSVIRQVSGGIITTVAGQGKVGGHTGDGGPATAATLSDPRSVAVDAGGNIYIAEWGNSAIRKVTGDPSHTISTIAVTAGITDYPFYPGYVLTDAQSNVYFGDLDSTGAISKIPSNVTSLTLSPATGNTGTLTLSNTGNANLTIFSISSLSSSFPVSGGTCPPGGFALTPGQSCTLSVSYVPSGSTAGTLIITSNTGSGANPPITSIALSESNGLYFVPIPPCRVVDTRLPAAGFGGPAFTAGETRNYNIRYSNTVGCSSVPIPAGADVQAYSLNVTAVPQGPLNFLTVYPSGTDRPGVSTLNSYDGRAKANAAIVPANINDPNRGISIYADSATHAIVDINGYYVPETSAAATIGGQTPLAFYPLPPCRVVDTRGTGPILGGAQGVSYSLSSGSCGLPSTAGAYALNLTAVPINSNPVGYLTAWPTGTPQPVVSTLNAPTGAVTANAAIIPAGANGSVSVYSSADTDLLIDVAGYYAPPVAGGLALYTVAPCRAFDSRNGGSSPLSANVPSSQNLTNNGNCSVPATAQSFVLNTTVIPSGGLGYLSAWATGTGQPQSSVLNAYDGQVTSNLAVVPTVNGSVSTYATSSTHLILDLFGYFAP